MSSSPSSAPWYSDITRGQWLILLLASAGWLFDVYEGQIFNITRGQLLQELLPHDAKAETILFYGDIFLGVFLAGGALGGILFGALADRWGRRPMLILTILTYSVFSGLTALAQDLWQVAALRFLVAVGVGGEWSVAAAMVAEAFATRGRAQAGSIFHATSILGTWLAGLAGWAVGSEWRYAYLVGVFPRSSCSHCEFACRKLLHGQARSWRVAAYANSWETACGGAGPCLACSWPPWAWAPSGESPWKDKN